MTTLIEPMLESMKYQWKQSLEISTKVGTQAGVNDRSKEMRGAHHEMLIHTSNNLAVPFSRLFGLRTERESCR